MRIEAPRTRETSALADPESLVERFRDLGQIPPLALLAEAELSRTLDARAFERIRATGQVPKHARKLRRDGELFGPVIGWTLSASPSLDALTDRFIDAPMLALYRDVRLPTGTDIAIVSRVKSDGWGDFHAQLCAADVLSRRFPDARIRLVTTLATHRREALRGHISPAISARFPIELVEAEEVFHARPRKSLPEATLASLARADVVLEVPELPEESLLSDLARIRRGETNAEAPILGSKRSDASSPLAILRLGELGDTWDAMYERQAYDFTPGFKGTELGVAFDSLARPERSAAEALARLTDPSILASLADKPFPSQADAERVAHEHSLAFGYVKGQDALLGFVLASAWTLRAHRACRQLDVLTRLEDLTRQSDTRPSSSTGHGGARLEPLSAPPLSSDTRPSSSTEHGRALLDRLSAPPLSSLLEAAGFGELCVRGRASSPRKDEHRQLNRDGAHKRLVIHDLGALAHEDVLSLIDASGLLVGCTGDASLLEVLNAKRLPFYHLRPHKRALFRDLETLARSHVAEPGLEQALALVRTMQPAPRQPPPTAEALVTRARSLGERLTDGTLEPALSTLRAVLRELDLAERLPSLVAAKLIHARHPEIARVDRDVRAHIRTRRRIERGDLEPLRAALSSIPPTRASP